MKSIQKILKDILRPLWRVYFDTIYARILAINKHRRTFGRMPNLISPKTFNDKILCKMLFDRDPKLTLFADKLLVRDFVRSRLGGDEHLTKLYGFVDNASEISNLNLPNQFVMKANHASGSVKIVYDINKLEKNELEKLAYKWLHGNYFYSDYEWAYKNIKPYVLFEELLSDEGQIPDDWKFYCFNGEPRIIEVHRARFTGHKSNHYDLNLSFIPVKFKLEHFHEEIKKPLNYDLMINIARKLSSGVDFIRVDLYNIKGRIIFGELTNYPAAGLDVMTPESWDYTYGSYWN